MRVISVDAGTTTLGLMVQDFADGAVVQQAVMAVDAWPTRQPGRTGLRCRTRGPLVGDLEFSVASPLEAVRWLVGHLGAELEGAVCAVEDVIWHVSQSRASKKQAKPEKGIAGRGQGFVDLVSIAARIAERLTVATGVECLRPTANDWRRGVFGLSSSLKGAAADRAVKAHIDAAGMTPLIDKAAGHVYDATGIGMLAARKADPKIRLPLALFRRVRETPAGQPPARSARSARAR